VLGEGLPEPVSLSLSVRLSYGARSDELRFGFISVIVFLWLRKAQPR
jgi:hypothetical protein